MSIILITIFLMLIGVAGPNLGIAVFLGSYLIIVNRNLVLQNELLFIIILIYSLSESIVLFALIIFILILFYFLK